MRKKQKNVAKSPHSLSTIHPAAAIDYLAGDV